MVKETKKSIGKKTSVKKTVKKTAAKSATVNARPMAKKTTTRKKPVSSVSEKVDYYPNRMTVAISALAGTLIVLFALIAVLGSQ